MQEKGIIKGYWGQFLQFLGMTLYRYFRLTPIYLLIIGLVQVSSKWYHDHSMIEFSALDYKTCEKFWWRNALYINTYFEMDERVSPPPLDLRHRLHNVYQFLGDYFIDKCCVDCSIVIRQIIGMYIFVDKARRKGC